VEWQWGEAVVKKSETVAYKTSRSGAMIITADELFTMLECVMKADHVESKGDAVAYIAGYMTGDNKFRDRIYDMIHQAENP
jgi:hypothetical protein